jgi:very-short-patch-repair endonuclease
MSIARARSLRKNASESEKRVWKALRLLRHEGLHFRRQPPIGPNYPDFACHRAKLIIELDGDSHTTQKQIAYDAERTRFLESIGYRVVRFWNVDAFGSADEIAQYILSLCLPPPLPPPLVGGGE